MLNRLPFTNTHTLTHQDTHHCHWIKWWMYKPCFEVAKIISQKWLNLTAKNSPTNKPTTTLKSPLIGQTKFNRRALFFPTISHFIENFQNRLLWLYHWLFSPLHSLLFCHNFLRQTITIFFFFSLSCAANQFLLFLFFLYFSRISFLNFYWLLYIHNLYFNLFIMNELDSLRQEAETLKNTIRVSIYIFFSLEKIKNKT